MRDPAVSKVFRRKPGRPYPVADRAEGVWIWDTEGRRYLDGSASACVVAIGHGVREVEEAALAQRRRLSFVHGATFMTEACERFAERIAALAPDPDLDKVYFVSSGSEAVETAVKLARQYWIEAGRPGRYKVISRWGSYHGNTLAALSWGGHAGRRRHYDALLLRTPHVEPCYCYRCPYGLDPTACGLVCAEALDRAVRHEGPETVAAFLAEPVVGATLGAVVPPPGYWPRIREICDHHGILLIADEVLTGAGRTGKGMALEHWGVSPDMAVLGKGLASGYAAVGAVLVHRRIHDTIRDGSGAFVHGFTYNQHPVSMAVGDRVLAYLEAHGLVERTARMGRVLFERLEVLREIPVVGDVRGLGLLAGVEFVADRRTREPLPADLGFAWRVGQEAMARGLLVYPGTGSADGVRGDHVLLAPPLVIGEDEIGFLVSALDEAIRAAAASVGAPGIGIGGSGARP